MNERTNEQTKTHMNRKYVKITDRDRGDSKWKKLFESIEGNHQGCLLLYCYIAVAVAVDKCVWCGLLYDPSTTHHI